MEMVPNATFGGEAKLKTWPTAKRHHQYKRQVKGKDLAAKSTEQSKSKVQMQWSRRYRRHNFCIHITPATLIELLPHKKTKETVS